MWELMLYIVTTFLSRKLLFRQGIRRRNDPIGSLYFKETLEFSIVVVRLDEQPKTDGEL